MNIKSVFAMAFMATALVGTTFSFVACEDDEKDQVIVGSQHDGTYKTQQVIAVGAGQSNMVLTTLQNKSVVLLTTKANNPLITVEGYQAPLQENAPYQSVSGQTFQLTNVKTTTLADGTAQLTGEEETTMYLRMVRRGQAEANVPYTPYKVTAKTQGTIKEGKLTLNVTFRPAGMPMDIIYTYTGQR